MNIIVDLATLTSYNEICYLDVCYKEVVYDAI